MVLAGRSERNADPPKFLVIRVCGPMVKYHAPRSGEIMSKVIHSYTLKLAVGQARHKLEAKRPTGPAEETI